MKNGLASKQASSSFRIRITLSCAVKLYSSQSLCANFSQIPPEVSVNFSTCVNFQLLKMKSPIRSLGWGLLFLRSRKLILSLNCRVEWLPYRQLRTSPKTRLEGLWKSGIRKLRYPFVVRTEPWTGRKRRRKYLIKKHEIYMELNCCCVRVLRMLKEYEFSRCFPPLPPLSLRSYIRRTVV